MIKIKTTILSLALSSAAGLPSQGAASSRCTSEIVKSAPCFNGEGDLHKAWHRREKDFRSIGGDSIDISGDMERKLYGKFIEIMGSIENYTEDNQPSVLLDRNPSEVAIFVLNIDNLRNLIKDPSEAICATVVFVPKSELLNELLQKVAENPNVARYVNMSGRDCNKSLITFSMNQVCFSHRKRHTLLFDLKECSKYVYEFFKDKDDLEVEVRTLRGEGFRFFARETPDKPQKVMVIKRRDGAMTFLIDEYFLMCENIRFHCGITLPLPTYFQKHFQGPVNEIIDRINEILNHHRPLRINDEVAGYRLLGDGYFRDGYRLKFINIENGTELQFKISLKDFLVHLAHPHPEMSITINDSPISVNSQDELDRVIQEREGMKLDSVTEDYIVSESYSICTFDFSIDERPIKYCLPISCKNLIEHYPAENTSAIRVNGTCHPICLRTFYRREDRLNIAYA